MAQNRRCDLEGVASDMHCTPRVRLTSLWHKMLSLSVACRAHWLQDGGPGPQSCSEVLLEAREAGGSRRKARRCAPALRCEMYLPSHKYLHRQDWDFQGLLTISSDRCIVMRPAQALGGDRTRSAGLFRMCGEGKSVEKASPEKQGVTLAREPCSLLAY